MSLEGNGYTSCFDCGRAYSRRELEGGLCARCAGRHDDDAAENDRCTCDECVEERSDRDHPDLADAKAALIDAEYDRRAEREAFSTFIGKQYPKEA